MVAGICAGAGVGLAIWRYAFWPHAQRGELMIVGIAAACPVLAPGTGVLHVLGTLWLWTALVLALCDLRVRRLPDALTLTLAGLALVHAVAMSALGSALIAAAVGAGSFAVVRWAYRLRTGRDGLGLGDVKLMAGLGAMVGIEHLAWVTLIAALAALGATVALGRLRGNLRDVALMEIPFGTYLCAAAFCVWVIVV